MDGVYATSVYRITGTVCAVCIACSLTAIQCTRVVLYNIQPLVCHRYRES